jgi:hypothetical protein
MQNTQNIYRIMSDYVKKYTEYAKKHAEYAKKYAEYAQNTQ